MVFRGSGRVGTGLIFDRLGPRQSILFIEVLNMKCRCSKTLLAKQVFEHWYKWG